MSLADPNDAREQIRQAVDIVDLIGSQLQLRRQGRNYVALCPWHDDSRPSLQVNPERQSWKCWVCDLGGDVFSYVMQSEGVEFREALALLAERAGIELKPRGPAAAPGSPDDKQALYQAVTWAEEQFHRTLLSASEAAAAREYCTQRGITPESLARFRIGFAPDQWQWLLDRARTSRFSPAVLEAVGLIGRSSSTGRPYDRFKGRLIFPIRDVQRRPIAFGGRVLPGAATDAAKYINSPETKLFAKSDQLYGLDLARDAAAKSRRVIVMEGYTDVVLAHQHGLTEATAVLGTALGVRHIKLLKRFADTIVLLLDGDEAGQRRTGEVLELFIAEQADLRVLTLPDGADPADYLLAHGGEGLRRLVDGAVDALEHLVRMGRAGIDPLHDVHQANQAVERILAVMAKAPLQRLGMSGASLQLREHQIITRLAREFAASEAVLQARLKELRRASPTNRPEASRSVLDERAERITLTPLERELLELLAAHGELAEAIFTALETGDVELSSPATRTILATYQRLQAEEGRVTFGRVLAELEQAELKSLWVEVDEAAHAKRERTEVAPAERLAKLCERFGEGRLRQSWRQTTSALQQTGLDEDEKLRLLLEMHAQGQARHRPPPS